MGRTLRNNLPIFPSISHLGHLNMFVSVLAVDTGSVFTSTVSGRTLAELVQVEPFNSLFVWLNT